MSNHDLNSLLTSTLELAQGIRSHWGLENRLHWVKDVVLGIGCRSFEQLQSANTIPKLEK